MMMSKKDDDDGALEPVSDDEDVPDALNDLVPVLEAKAAKYNLSRVNVKNILKHVMQSEEMINFLHEELSNEGNLSSNQDSSDIFGSSIRMTRQKFRQLASDKVCPDLEQLLSRLPPAPSAPKSFFELDFPEDDPEDAEYDPRFEDDILEETPSLSSPQTFSIDTVSRVEPLSAQPTTQDYVGKLSTNDEGEEIIACRTRSRFPLRDVDLDAIAPLPPEVNLDLDSLSPPSSVRPMFSSGLLSVPGSERCPSPADDEEVYVNFLATVFDDEEEDLKLKHKESATVCSTPATNPEPIRTPFSVATDEEPDDPDYNPLQDIDALLEFDPDEYAWDKRARIPKEEVRSLRKEAFADLPIHCHLLETCAEATAVEQEENETAEVQRKRPASVLKGQSPLSKRQHVNSSDSSSSSDSDDTFVETPVEENNARPASPQSVLVASDNILTNVQHLILQEQMRQHIQLLVQSYVMAGNSAEVKSISTQSVQFLSELDDLRGQSPYPQLSYYNAFNLQPALDFVKNWPPELIGCPKSIDSEEVKKQLKRNKGNRRDRARCCRPRLSNRQFDLMAFHCPALIYAGLLPRTDEGFYPNTEMKLLERIPWLPSEDDLLALGLEQFWPAAKKLLDKANLIQRYLIPAKNAQNIRMRMKNVFYSAFYENDMENPVKIFQKYGVAPQYETAVCCFQPEEVTPLRFLPSSCLPRWFNARIRYWNEKAKDSPESVIYLADEFDVGGGFEGENYQHVTDKNGPPSSVAGTSANSSIFSEIEFPRGNSPEPGDNSSNNINISQQKDDQGQANKPGLINQVDLTSSISLSHNEAGFASRLSSSDSNDAPIIESSVSIGHGFISGADEEAAVFLTPVKPSCQELRQWDSDSKAGPSWIDAGSSDSLPVNQHFQQNYSPLRNRQPLLARLLESMSPRAGSAPGMSTNKLAVAVIGPVTSSTPSASNVLSHTGRRKRARKTISNELRPKRLRPIAPASTFNAPSRALLDPSELNSLSHLFGSSSPGKSKVVESIRAKALKHSRAAAVKRNLSNTASQSSTAPAPSTEVGTSFLPSSESGDVVKTKPKAIARKRPPRLNEKQRLRLQEMCTATITARETANAGVDVSKTGASLPLCGLAYGCNFQGDVVDTELAITYIDLLEKSLRQDVFVEVLSIFNAFHNNLPEIDVLSMYSSLKNLLSYHGNADLLINFASFLTAKQAYDCDCYQDFTEFDAICDFLTQHAVAFGSRSSKSLQSLVRILKSSTSTQPKTFSALQSEINQIFTNQSQLTAQLGRILPNAPPASNFSSQDFENIDRTTCVNADESQIEFEQVRFNEVKYGTRDCPCDCHSSGVPIRVSAFVAAQLANFKRHCRNCGVTISQGKLYIPDEKAGFRLKRIFEVNEENKYELFVKPYLSNNDPGSMPQTSTYPAS